MQGKCAFLHYRYTKCMSEPVRVWLLGTYEFEYRKNADFATKFRPMTRIHHKSDILLKIPNNDQH